MGCTWGKGVDNDAYSPGMFGGMLTLPVGKSEKANSNIRYFYSMYLAYLCTCTSVYHYAYEFDKFSSGTALKRPSQM
jgi:hypothetical protein